MDFCDLCMIIICSMVKSCIAFDWSQKVRMQGKLFLTLLISTSTQISYQVIQQPSFKMVKGSTETR